MTYPVAEIFKSINGESLRAGEAAVFVRFRGCNLACPYCDTKWANRPDCPVTRMTAEDLLSDGLIDGVLPEDARLFPELEPRDCEYPDVPKGSPWYGAVGAAAAVVMLAMIWLTRYLSVGAAAGAVIMIITALLVVDGRLLMTLSIMTAALVLVYHVPALLRLSQGREERLSFEEDITYKFDEKF